MANGCKMSSALMVVVVMVLNLQIAEASGEWVYDWPYGNNGECRCKSLSTLQVPTGYETEAECITAFSHETYEYCTTTGSGGGITEADCSHYAVSISPNQNNLDCEIDCLKLVVGTMPRDQFFENCKLETVAQSESSIAPLASGCFVNYVLGHADFNPDRFSADASLEPIKIFEEVDSANRCQALCQQMSGCAWFQWRGVSDDDCNAGSSGYQHAPLTCELYNYHFVETVMSTDVHGSDLKPEGNYLNGVCDLNAYDDKGCSDLFNTDSWKPFGQMKCLSCECEPRCAYTSYSHISGPAYCTADIATDVCTIKPPLPHTTAPPTCETSECPEQTTGQSSSTSAGETTPSTTSPGQTTSPGGEVTTAGSPQTTTDRWTHSSSRRSTLTSEAATTTTPSDEEKTTTTMPGKTTSPSKSTSTRSHTTHTATRDTTKSTTPDSEVTTAGSPQTTTTGVDDTTTSQPEGTSTTIWESSTTPSEDTTTGLETTTEESTTDLETTTEETTVETTTPASTRTGPCPPCNDEDDCPPCKDDCEDCLDASWEPEDFDQ